MLAVSPNDLALRYSVVMRRGTDVALAAQVLRQGGLIAFPTETVYGLGANASDAAAVAKIFTVKQRPRNHPLIVHLATAEEAARWASDWTEVARVLTAAFWPGPLTLIVPAAPPVSAVVTGGATTVGIRVPSHPTALALLSAFGGGIAAPSANRFGATSATTADHVESELGDQVDYILEGAACDVGVESTIVDVSISPPTLLRPGGITRDELAAVLGHPPGAASHGHAPAPGTLSTHYAPRTTVVAATSAAHATALVAGAAGTVALLGRDSDVDALGSLPARVHPSRLPDDPKQAARVLYQRLRDLDAQGFEQIIALLPPALGLGEAIVDRLQRAAGPRPPTT